MAFIQKISYDALVGPDDSTWEWQEEMDEKIQVERVMRDILEKVVEDAERLPVARVLFAEDEDSEDLSDIELTDEDISEREYFNWIDTRVDSLRRCDVCSQNEWTIWERVRTGRGEPVDSLREHEGRLMCGCCQEMLGTPFSEYNFCCNCFISEKMGKRYGISMLSIGGVPDEHVCSVCNDIYPDLVGDSGGEWTQLLDGTWVLDGVVQDDDFDEYSVYDGEYENEDPPENNAELARGIKGAISEIGENLFDMKEKLTEGEYLKLMDLLQKVTNDVNRL
jgi:hypothetical protein